MAFTSPPTAVTGGTVDASYTNLFSANDNWFHALLPAPTAANQIPISNGTISATWGLVSSSQIAPQSITGNVFAAGVLTSSKFATGSVTLDKITTTVQGKLLITSLEAFVRTVAEIPSGWTRDANMSGRLPIAAGAAGGTTRVVNTDYGSSWSHSHVANLSLPPTPETRQHEAGSMTGASLTSHSHTTTGSTASVAWMPPSRAYVFIIKD